MKKTLSILLAVVFCLTLFPLTASADETYYDIYIAGVQISSANKDDLTAAVNANGGTASGEITFDPETNTLTLKNASVDGSGIGTGGLNSAMLALRDGSSIKKLTVAFSGSNTISCNQVSSSYVNALGALNTDLVFEGADDNSSLTISAKTPTVIEDGAVRCNSITVNNGTVTLAAPEESSGNNYGNNPYGASLNGSGTTLTVNSGKLIAKGWAPLVADNLKNHVAEGTSLSGSENYDGSGLKDYDFTTNGFYSGAFQTTYRYVEASPKTSTPAVTEVTVTFVSSNDGTGEKKTVQTTPGEYTLPPCDFTSPTGKQFKAWLVGNEEKQPGDKINVTSNQTITALWADVFTVSFDTGGYSDVPPEQTVMKGEKAKKPDLDPVPYKDDLTFGGWKIVENGSEKDYDFDTPVEKDIKLIAIWYVKTTPSYVTESYSLTLMKAYFVDGNAPAGSTDVYESEVVITTAVVKEPTYTSSGVIEYIASAQDPSKETHILKTWTEIIPPLSGSSDWIRKSLAMGAALFNPPKKQTGSRLPEPEKQPDPVVVTVDAETPAIADEPAEPEIPFVDAAPGDPYYTAIVYAFRSGLMKGISDTEFGPSGTLNRAMFVTILGRMDQIDPADYDGCPFEDCEPLGDWDYLPYVAWAAEKGIVLGFGDGTFRPFDPVTNEQAVLMLRRYADYLGRETAAPEIAYEGASPWASAAVAWAFADGIYPTETEAPFTSPAERGWTARAFYNLVGFLTK